MQEVIKQKMSQMKLYGMHQAYQTLLESTQQHLLTNDEVVSQLINPNGRNAKPESLTGT